MENTYEFKIIFNKIKQIVIENDPVGLIDGGAPHDEYDDQIFQLIKLIGKVEVLEELASNVYKIFDKEFEEMVKIDQCRRIAELILQK